MSITTESRVPVVGDRVIATNIPHVDDNPDRYSEELRRQVVTVTEVSNIDGRTRLYADFRDPSSGYTHNWFFTEWRFPDEIDSSSTDVEALRLAVSGLRTQVNEFRTSYENERSAHMRIRNNFERSMEIVGSALNREADNRGWCSEYDDIVDSVNNDLPGPYMLPERAREYEVTWTETYTVKVSRSATIRAKSEDEAIDDARDWESADEYLIRRAVENGEYEYEASDDYEASEQ